MMNGPEKSDSLVVPMKLVNKASVSAAESMEGSSGIARNANLQRTARTLSRISCVPGAGPHTCGRFSTVARSLLAIGAVCGNSARTDLCGGAQQWVSLPRSGSVRYCAILEL
jgi:hypothetical protein